MVRVTRMTWTRRVFSETEMRSWTTKTQGELWRTLLLKMRSMEFWKKKQLLQQVSKKSSLDDLLQQKQQKHWEILSVAGPYVENRRDG